MNIIKEQPITAKLLADESIARYDKCYAKGEKDNRLSFEFPSYNRDSKKRTTHKIFNDIEISYADIEGLDLCDTKLFGGNISNTNFNHSNIEEIVITGITFNKVNFYSVEFEKVEFRECHFTDCIFEDCILRQTKFNDCQFELVKFQLDYGIRRADEGEFPGEEYHDECEFVLCEFNLCEFTKFELANGKFFKCKFIDTEIDDSAFRTTSFTEVEFIQNKDAKIGSIEFTNFQECEMRFSEFNEFHRIMGCNFQNSKLEHVDFGNSLVENLGFLNVSLEKTYYRGTLLTIPKIKNTSFKMNYLKGQGD